LFSPEKLEKNHFLTLPSPVLLEFLIFLSPLSPFFPFFFRSGLEVGKSSSFLFSASEPDK